jgi:hypothetical protein
MSDAIDCIREFHSTGSFGICQRLLEAEEKARDAYRSLTPDEIEELLVPAIESKVENIGRNFLWQP